MNPLEIIENVFQIEAGPELVAASYQIALPQVDEISNALWQWAEEFTPTEKRENELRPLVRRDQHLWGRIDCESPELPHLAADQIKQYLLFAHSIALEENLSHSLSQAGRKYGGIQTVRNFLPPSLASMVSLAPLIRQGIVILVPGTHMSSRSNFMRSTNVGSRAMLDPWLRVVNDWAEHHLDEWEAKSISRVPFPDFSQHQGVTGDSTGASREMTVADFKAAYLHRSFNDVVNTMASALSLERTVDVNFPTPVDLRVFELLIEEGATSMQRVGIESSALTHLLQLELPNIVNLSARDLISIRSNDDLFEGWRSQLSLALQDARLGGDARDPWALRRGLRESELTLRDELQRRSLKGLSKQGVRDLLLGSAGITTGAAVFHSLSVATAAGVAGLAGRLVLEFGLKLHRRDATDAALSHYSVLGHPRNE